MTARFARCVVRSFDVNGNEELWMEAVIGQIDEMNVGATERLGY